MLRVAEANVQKIYTHPFNRHLYRGTLSPLAFRHFVMQDQIYLHHFAKTLMVITKRLPHKEQQYKFERLATRMIRTEQTLLQKYLKPSPYLFFSAHSTRRESPVIKAYRMHLLDGATHASIATAIAGCIPCFWIYCRLGEQMPGAFLPDNHPYKDWVQTYSSPSFRMATQYVVEVFNEYAQYEQQQAIDAMTTGFCRSVAHERHFLDEAYEVSCAHAAHYSEPLNSCP
ncbi:Thiaminase-2 [Legionella oakridgensis]|uniref:Thiaminase-2 n=4 Tax=Legionella oakridgensis TaxID=29423 RepID=A0A0W0WXY9_9GAMM|nr:Thiaminase-2 [Legionella oakridgensis]